MLLYIKMGPRVQLSEANNYNQDRTTKSHKSVIFCNERGRCPRDSCVGTVRSLKFKGCKFYRGLKFVRTSPLTLPTGLNTVKRYVCATCDTIYNVYSFIDLCVVPSYDAIHNYFSANLSVSWVLGSESFTLSDTNCCDLVSTIVTITSGYHRTKLIN